MDSVIAIMEVAAECPAQRGRRAVRQFRAVPTFAGLKLDYPVGRVPSSL